MLLSLKANNCLIYNDETEFSMRANMHYKRFPNNVATFDGANVLKTAILIGPNNSGKTNFVRVLSKLRGIMLNQGERLSKNLFSSDPTVELAVSFLEGGSEFLFEIRYDVSKQEYIYERYAQISRDKHGNEKTSDLLVRDSVGKRYFAEDPEIEAGMKLVARNNILIYVMNTDNFPLLQKIKDAVVGFASRIDIVDMNNIPIQKTIDMLKRPDEYHERIANFIRNADLSLDDYRYLSDDEVKVSVQNGENGESQPQERAIAASLSSMDYLRLASVYRGVVVPSMFYDSTGTKKMAALASYVIDALEKGRILIVDELDNSLHFRLTRAIITLFNNEKNINAQLIATVHDVSLLDCQTLFRKEQIWFTHKDKKSAYLYSLAEFTAEKDGIRDTTDLIEKYRKGVFGALPEPDLFQSLLEVREHGQ